jgi:hypothetical protein
MPGVALPPARPPAAGLTVRRLDGNNAMTKTMHIPRPLLALTVALAMFLLVSCNGNGKVSGSSSGSANLRVVDLAYGAPSNFDVLQDTTSVVTDLAYGDATAFQAISSGSVTVKFEPTGTTTVSITAGISPASGTDYSVIALQGSSALTYLTVAQGITTLGSGQAQLCFVNAAPAVGTVDFYVTTPTAALPATASQSGIAYAGDAASVTPVPLLIDSGDYRIRAVASGGTSVVFDSGPLTFAAGATPLLIMTSVSGSAAVFSIASLGADSTVTTIGDQRVQVRVGNFAPAFPPGNGAVDVYFDQNGAANSATTPFETGLAQNAASSPYVALLPGAYHASFTNTGQTTELLGSDISLVAGTSVSVFAAGISGQAAPYDLKLLELRDDLRAPAAGFAKLRVVYLAPDLAGSVDLVTLVTTNSITTPGQTIIGNLPYAGASTYATLAPGSYTLAVVPTGATTPIFPTSAGVAVNLTADTVTTLVVAGCQHPGSGICAAAATPLQFVQLTD